MDPLKLADGFDPQESAWDRRLLYEVAGIRLRDHEFRGEYTSSEGDSARHHSEEDDERFATGARQPRATFDIDRLDQILTNMMNQVDQDPGGDSSALLGE